MSIVAWICDGFKGSAQLSLQDHGIGVMSRYF